MSIETSTLEINGRRLYWTRHNKYKIKQTKTSKVYDEAFDVRETDYELTNILRDKEVEENGE